MIRRLLFYTFLTFTFTKTLSAAVCLPEWKYSRSVTVNNSNASAYSNFQVKIIVNTQALITAGKMKANGDDIRFTDANCNNLHYWIDSNLNTTTTVIWVKVNTLGASGNTTINMFYGNYCAVAAQNGDSTFLLFDDFLGSTLNAAKWNSYRNVPGNTTLTIAGGIANFTATATTTDNTIRSVNTFVAPLRLESKITSNSGTFPSIAQLNSGTFDGVTLLTGNGGLFNDQFHTFGTAGACASYSSGQNTSGVARASGVWGLTWTATNAAQSSFPGGTQNLAATPAISTSVHAALGLLCASNGSASFDWLRLRSYAPIEMGSTVNTETNNGVIQITFSPQTICPGSNLTVTVTKSGYYFNLGNSFSIELSNAAGSFASPTVLGIINDTIPDTITAMLSKLLAPGNGYKVRVTSTSPALNCFAADANLTVLTAPVASYTFPNDNQCFTWNRYNFTSNSTIAAGSIDSFLWSWDDQSGIDTLYTNTASHKFFPYFNYYYPRLTVISNLGCRDTFSRRVNMRESLEIITVFSDTIQCYKGNRFIIESETVPLSGTVTFKSWDLGDGSAVINNVDSFAHSYASDGIYDVRQINHHSNGCIDTFFLALLVNEHPVAVIATNDTDQCITGNYFEYESFSTINNGLPLINYWNIGDGITADMKDSLHYRYNSATSRTVTLITISDDGEDGCADTAQQVIFVNPIPVAAITNVDADQCFNGNRFRFYASSTISSGTLTHSWDFGDLSGANNIDTVLHSYLTDGSYSIKLNVVSNRGCVDSIYTNVDVRPSPTPSFYVNQNTQCFKYHSVKAYSTSTINSGTISNDWTLSGPISFTDVDSIHHAFSGPGAYNIELIVTSNFNCKDTISDSVFILNMPLSDFTVDNADQCFEGNIFAFTDNSTIGTGNITGNQWIFDDGNTAFNLSNVSHSYLTENAYIPALVVYADNGCFDTSFQNIKVYPHPGSDFFINDTGQCVNDNNFAFTNNTFISEGGFTNRWFFGDGSPFVQGFNASKKYTKDSTYVVRVISISDQGCTDTAQKTVTVFPKAITGFTIDNAQQCLLGNLFGFTANTTIKRGSFVHNWQFGDLTFDGNVNTTSHSYNNVQTYTVRLISTSNEGCRDTVSRTVRTLAMPVANFNYNYLERCLLGHDFQFNASSTVSPNTPMNHKWFFGDNDSTINSTFAQHSYATDGVYTVRLISSTNIGACKDTLERNFTVHPMPVASFTIDDDRQCLKDNLFGFTSTSTLSSGTIDFYNWALGDNSTSGVTTPSKSYTKVDSFRVSLVITTDKGCIDSTFDKVYVYPMPVASFSITPKDDCLKGNLFRITNSSSIVNGIISNYLFDYGDGSTSVVQNPPSYTYSVSGDYTISLRVTTDQGCWDTVSRTISVNPNPVIDFTVDPECLNDSSTFINNSTIPSGSIASWKWIFGNGRTSTLQSPKHKYRNVGAYDVMLIATTDKNCVDTLEKLAYAIVNPNPVAGFYYQKLRSWENEVDIQYVDTSIDAISWNWNFASMGSSTDQNPKLFYIDTLTQTTTLIVANIFGCRDTTVQTIFITPDVVYYMPSAFTPNDDGINETFKPIGLAYAINYKFIIFNRWGEILFDTDNPQIGWNGTYEGQLVEQDLYFYRLEFVGVDELRHEEKGNVMILR